MTQDSEDYLLQYQSAQDYLKLSRLYAEYLGGLRWSGVEDAVVDGDNHSFAFCEAIAEFVEGFASHGRVIAFGYLLHWMDLLQGPRLFTTPAIGRLQLIFAEALKNWRFAGAFAATLSDDVPELPNPPDLATVGKRLRNRAFPVRWFTAQFHEKEQPPQRPPIEPALFEETVIRKLAAYSENDLRTWLRTGRGPIRQAERLAHEPPAPRSLARVLAALVERPRLAGAQTYVTQLVGALSLPPRRFVPQELPVGGYTDIVTRGQVEQLLPTQFALDELEFLRRFVEKELLYFRREEPPAQNRQELVVLLDQGVRTWGDVRLVLSAAALAFGKQAVLRQTPFFLATTSNAGHIIAPTQVDEEALGHLIEASDLSLNPGLALEQTLETPSEVLRDVVLLTHPRSLKEEDVLNAARRLGVRDRLFAVALDARGQVEVSEIRRGTPIKVRQFHIDFAPSRPKAPTPRRDLAAPSTQWTGEVETIPFPFRLGTEAHVTHFDFDYDGDWLFTVSGQGTLHVWKLDGSAVEMLPRPCRGPVLKNIIAVLGVIGGFVVVGKHLGDLVMAHYDLVRRHTTWYDLGPSELEQVICKYVPEQHSVFVRNPYETGPALTTLVELDSEEVFWNGSDDVPARAKLSWAKVHSAQVLDYNRKLTTTHSDTARCPAGMNVCHLFLPTGTFYVRDGETEWGPNTPVTEGKPSFQLASWLDAQLAGTTLAVRAYRRDIGHSITLMHCEDGAIVREYPVVRGNHKIARHLLSFDGSRIALLRSDHRVDVDPVYDRSLPNLSTRVGGFTMEASFTVGTHCVILYLGASKQFWHLFDWSSGTLIHYYERIPVKARRSEDPPFARYDSPFFGHGPYRSADANQLPTCCREDRERYLNGVADPSLSLRFVLDRFGQLTVLELNDRVLAMFIAFRDRHAAWMPDGTRFGSLTLSLAHATPGAAEKIGRTLLRAEKGEAT